MENVNNSYQNTAVSELGQEFLDVLPDGYEGIGDAGELSALGIDSLLAEIGATVKEGGGEVLSFLFLIFGVTLLVSLVSLVCAPMQRAASGGVSAAASLAVFGALYPMVSSAVGALRSMGEFFGALVPILTSFLALGGGAGTASGAATGLGITVWLLGLLSGKLLLPIMTAIFATSALSSAFGGASARVAESIKRAFTSVIGILTAAVAALFALQTYVSVCADSVAMRAAKYAAGGLIPIVGGAVSGALSTLAGGLGSLGGVIGGSSVAVIALMALSPLVMLLLYRLAFYLCGMLGDILGGGKCGCISAFASALDTLIAAYIMTTIIYIFEVILLIWGGNKIFGA